MNDGQGQPTAFLFTSESDYFALKDVLLAGLRNVTSEGIGVRVRGGSILTSAVETLETTYGVFEDGRGRSLERYTQGVRPALEFQRRIALWRSLRFVWGADLASIPAQHLDTLVVSALSTSSALHLAERLNDVSPLLSVGQFNPGEPLADWYLWRTLILTAMVSQGETVRALEDAPEFSQDSDGEWFLDPRPDTYRPPGVRGFFVVSEFDETERSVILEPRAFPFDVPSDLPKAAPLSSRRTPVSRVVQGLQFETGKRISSQDDRDATATVRRSQAELEFPDAWHLEQKVALYLLDPEQKEQKWRGFAAMGYRSPDALVLAGLLSSALLSDFPFDDARPTADGALQFSVPVLLPGSRGGKVPLMTAWYYKPGTGVQLSTALPNVTATEYASPRLIPPECLESWNRLIDYVEAEASAFGVDYVSSAKSFGGWLWVPEVGSTSQADFYRWLKRHKRVDTFTRVAYGGRVAQYFPVGAGLATETQVAAELRLAQAVLATCGIRAAVQMHGD